MKIFDKITEIYYKIIPYDYRPGELLYKLKCRLWRHHNTVKCRYLPPTWNDRVDILPHVMFEVLAQFVEQEYSEPEIVGWEASGHIVKVNGKDVDVRAEMQDLYDWWVNTYNGEFIQKKEEYWDEISKHPMESYFEKIDSPSGYKETLYTWDPQYETEEDEKIVDEYYGKITELDKQMDRELHSRLHRLINLRHYLWT